MRSRKQSLYTKAREAFLKGLNIAQKKKIKRHEAHFLHSNADVYNHLHDAIQADAFYKSAAEAYQQLGDTLGMARLENNRALLLKDNPGEALTMLEAALKKYIVLKNTRGQGIAFLNKGNIYFNLNRLDECRLSYQRALEAFRQSGYVSGQAKALFSLGNVYVRQQEYEEGLKAYTAAQEFFKKINNMEGEAAALTGIGGVYRTKEPQKALTFYQSALGLTKNPYQQAVVHGNIANIYSDKMEFDNAISAYKKALDIFDRIQDSRSVAQTLANIGRVLGRQCRIDKALEFIGRSRAVYKQIGGEPIELARDEALLKAASCGRNLKST